MVNPLLRYIDRQTKQIEVQTEALIKSYMQMLDSSPDARSLRDLAREGSTSPEVLGEHAVGIHRALFQHLLETTPRERVLRKKQRVMIVEQFCVALWIKFVGRAGFDVMRERLGLVERGVFK